MQRSEMLKKLFKAYQRGSDKEFRAAAKAIVADERAKRRKTVANELEQILDQFPSELPRISRAKTSSEDAGLLFAVREPRIDLGDLVLGPVTAGLVERLIRDFTGSNELERSGILMRYRALFCGPSGCGKTVAAEGVAKELGLNLLVVRFAMVIEPSLAKTAANLETALARARQEPMVVLFDELDMIGRSRDDVQGSPESRGALNCFLQALDAFDGKGILIAATNFEQSLDFAVWRRFRDVIRFERPREPQIEQLVRKHLASVEIPRPQVEDLVRNLAGSTHAEVEMVCLDVRKSCVLRKQEVVEGQDVREAVARRVYRQSILQKIAKAATATVDRD